MIRPTANHWKIGDRRVICFGVTRNGSRSESIKD
jgi:hypothetical protein